MACVGSLVYRKLFAVVCCGRRQWFFGEDVACFGMHAVRSLLGDEFVHILDVILKCSSLDYCSVRALIRGEGWAAIQT